MSIDIESEQLIREAALRRISTIFDIPINDIKPYFRFGRELKGKPKGSFMSEFKWNELDKVDDDIHDVADKNIINEFISGRLVIQTVDDYCNLMVRCSKSNSKRVKKILFKILFDEKW